METESKTNYDLELLKQLYCIYSPSGDEKRLRKFIRRYIRENIPDCKIEQDQTGNLYVTKGQSDTYPCIVSHIDQVQKVHSRDFQAYETGEVIFGYSSRNKRQEGLGADDKNGIWICLQCLRSHDHVKAAFFVGEETGCIGSSKADMDFFRDCRFVLQCDRRGKSDLITNIGGWTALASEEFIDATGYRNYGYKPETGLSTDVGELKERGLGISVLNISCGYYEPHTGHEMTIIPDLINCLEFVRHIIGTCIRTYPHEPEDCYDCYGYPYGYDKGFEMDELLEIIGDDVMANPGITAAELKDMYGDWYDDLTLNDFETVLEECKAMYFIR